MRIPTREAVLLSEGARDPDCDLQYFPLPNSTSLLPAISPGIIRLEGPVGRPRADRRGEGFRSKYTCSLSTSSNQLDNLLAAAGGAFGPLESRQISLFNFAAPKPPIDMIAHPVSSPLPAAPLAIIYQVSACLLRIACFIFSSQFLLIINQLTLPSG